MKFTTSDRLAMWLNMTAFYSIVFNYPKLMMSLSANDNPKGFCMCEIIKN